MFASNFPVDSLCATFDEIFDTFKEATNNFNYDDKFYYRWNSVRVLFSISKQMNHDSVFYFNRTDVMRHSAS